MLRTVLLARAVGAFAIVLAMDAPALAAQGDGGVFTFLIENDAIVDADGNYTNGLKLNYLAGSKARDPLRDLLRSAFWDGDGETVLRSSFSIGQSLFTPENLSIATPQPNDRPYAGWLYAGYGIVAERPSQVTTIDLELGVVGPSAGGKWLQQNFHGWIGENEPQGWDNQIADEFGIDLTVDRRWRMFDAEFLGIGASFEPNLGATLGTVVTEGFAGATLRVGNDLGMTSLPLRVRPSLAGTGSFDETSGIGWFVFGGAAARAVGYNLLIDGDTSYVSNVEKKTFVLDAQAGAALRLARFQVTFTYVIRSKEFDQQLGNERFGALAFSWHF